MGIHNLGGGGELTFICRDTGMCHVLFGVLRDFWVPFWTILGCLGIIIFLVKFDFFRNNPDFGY